MSFLDSAAETFLRTAIKKVTKVGFTLVTGPCGHYDECGRTHAGKLPKTKRVCLLCAAHLIDKLPTSTTTSEKLLEEVLADNLGVSTDWVISMLQGFDGDDECTNGEPTAFKIGKKLAREVGAG